MLGWGCKHTKEVQFKKQRSRKQLTTNGMKDVGKGGPSFTLGGMEAGASTLKISVVNSSKS